MSKGYKIRAIIKRPDERYGHVTNISDTLKNLQGIVGGKIEALRISEDAVIICNEEGKQMGLKPNIYIGTMPYGQLIVGDIIVLGVDGEEFTDCPIDFKTWKWLVNRWEG